MTTFYMFICAVSLPADHRAFGMTALAMMVVQGLLGAVRPHLGTKARPVWRRVHQAWGWLTLLVGKGSVVVLQPPVATLNVPDSEPMM